MWCSPARLSTTPASALRTQNLPVETQAATKASRTIFTGDLAPELVIWPLTAKDS
jgi:hypothetical protein